MQFLPELRPRIKSGEITTSIRIWQRPHVKVGGRYRLDGGVVVVEAIREIALEDVTPEMARASGFRGLVDLLKTARHGSGSRVYWIRFHFRSAVDDAS